jgi:Ca2+-binding EF-hand superfamily protein
MMNMNGTDAHSPTPNSDSVTSRRESHMSSRHEIEKEIESIWKLFDHDGNGVVDRSEIQGMPSGVPNVVVSACPEEEVSALTRNVHSVFFVYECDAFVWCCMFVDGTLAAMIKLFYGGAWADARPEEIDSVLQKLDTDGSKTVDKHEFVKGLADFVETSMESDRLASPKGKGKGKRKLSSEDERQVIHAKVGMFFLQYTAYALTAEDQRRVRANVETARQRFALQKDRVRKQCHPAFDNHARRSFDRCLCVRIHTRCHSGRGFF